MSSTDIRAHLRILVWPAERPVPQAVLAQLAAEGHQIDLAASADAARRQIQLGLVDLAVVDPGLFADEPALRHAADELAIVLQAPDDQAFGSAAAWMRALESGAQDILLPGDWALPGAARRLQAACKRHHLARVARRAYATDLATGLPHQQQLLEHMSHLLALREREPAPMALLVLRIEGFATTAAELGEEAAGALRRKVAVRLRSGLRASDVVAAIGSDSFAVLLAWIDAAADVDGVCAKLVSAVQRPFSVAGHPVALAVSVGLSRYPDDGKDAPSLLQMAVAQAARLPGQGRAGFVNRVERGAVPAANDESA